MAGVPPDIATRQGRICFQQQFNYIRLHIIIDYTKHFFDSSKFAFVFHRSSVWWDTSHGVKV